MAKVEIYKIKKTAPQKARIYSVFDYMRDGENPNPLHYVREWAGEMHGTLPLTIPGRLMLNPPEGYQGGEITNGDIAVVNGTPYFMDKLSGSKFVEIDFDAAAVRDEIHVRYGWFVDAKDAEKISEDLAFVCDDIGIPCGHLGDSKSTGIFNGRRPFLPGASDENPSNFLHPDFMKGEDARAFISLLSELTELECWPAISDYLREHYPAGQQDLEKARELFAPELLLPAELHPLSKVIPADADKSELAYLTAKISGMNENQRDIFYAVIEAEWHCESVAEMINLTENLEHFDLEPAFTVSQYGEFRLENDWDICEAAIRRLEKSEDHSDRFLVKFITLLNRCADNEAYGYHAAKDDGGVFTKYGYISQGRGLDEKYRDVQDIPAQYRVAEPLTAPAERQAVMVCNTDLATLLLEMHALGGDYMKDARYNLQTLAADETDFFVMMNGQMLTVTPADFLFRRDMIEHQVWMQADNTPEVRTFIMTVTAREDGRVTGNLFEAELETLRRYIRENSFFFTHLDVEMKDGSSSRLSLEKWDAMDRFSREQIISWVKHYDPADESRLEAFLGVIRREAAENRQAVLTGQFLAKINEPFMSQAKNPQPGMLRVTLEAAKEILAQNAAHVFRLTKGGMDKLTPVDAAKSGLWYSVDREFAVRLYDWAGIDRWARRATAEILRQTEHNDLKKSRDIDI